MQLLCGLEFLTVYGIHTLPTPTVALLALLTRIVLIACSAAVAIGSLLYRSSAALLTGETRALAGGGTHES